MDTTDPLLILCLGAVIVLIDGRVMYRSSIDYLAEVYQQRRAHHVAKLATVLFELVMLGAVFLLASLTLGPDAGIQPLLARIGVLLLLTALAHGITMAVLSRLREQQLSTLVAEARLPNPHPRPLDPAPTVDPAEPGGPLPVTPRGSNSRHSPHDPPQAGQPGT